MARTDSSHWTGSGDRTTDAPIADDVVIDLRDDQPLVDLRGAPSIRLAGPLSVDASIASNGSRGATQADLQLLERRDATQRARYIAVLIIAALNVLDIVTTYTAIALGAHEGNPIVAWMISSRFVIFAKILVCGALIFGAIVASNRRTRSA